MAVSQNSFIFVRDVFPLGNTIRQYRQYRQHRPESTDRTDSTDNADNHSVFLVQSCAVVWFINKAQPRVARSLNFCGFHEKLI